MLGIELAKSHAKMSGNHIPPRWKQILQAYFYLFVGIVSLAGFLFCLAILFS